MGRSGGWALIIAIVVVFVAVFVVAVAVVAVVLVGDERGSDVLT